MNDEGASCQKTITQNYEEDLRHEDSVHGSKGQDQGSRKSKIGWELTKNGCHV